jgi:hypothetical protein
MDLVVCLKMMDKEAIAVMTFKVIAKRVGFNCIFQLHVSEIHIQIHICTFQVHLHRVPVGSVVPIKFIM